MTYLDEHHLKRLEALAKATGESAADVLTRAFADLEEDYTAGELTAWLYAESVRVGLEKPSHHRDRAEELGAWQALEAEAPAWPTMSRAQLEEEIGT